MKACLILVFTATCAALADPGLIRLKNATINPKAPVLQSEEKFLCSPTDSGKRNYVVQPKANFSPQELEGLAEYGMKVIGHIPPNAYVIQADPKGLEEFKTETNPLYVGEFRPEYKISKDLEIEAGVKTCSSGSYRWLWLELSDQQEFKSVKKELETLGASGIFLVSKTLNFVQAKVPEEAIEKISALSAVLSIEARPEARLFNYFSHQANCLNSDAINTLGYYGSGEKVLVCDSGIDSGNISTIHPDFQDMAIDMAVGWIAAYPTEYGGGGRSETDYYDYNGHGTHVAGTVLGRGTQDYRIGNNSPHKHPGVASKAALGFLAIASSSGSGAVYYETEEDLNPFYENGYRICNNSWGGGTYGSYSYTSCLYDTYMWHKKDFLMLFAAGNENEKIDVVDNCTISTQASSKNVLTVGASESFNSECTYVIRYNVQPYYLDKICWPSDDEHQGMAYFSSHGPCLDGRIKPDLVAPGSWITSVMALKNDPNRSKLYTQMSGTSMATPNACGCAAIVREYLRTNEFLANPSAAMVKAVLINGCRSMGTGQYTNKTDPNTGLPYVEIPDTTPNCVSGYGHINLVESLTPAAGNLTLLEDAIDDGEIASYRFVRETAGPVKATLCWTDYPGTTYAAQILVNDLDLEVSDGTTTYYAGGATSKSDSINNVEQYSNASFPAGENITVRVRGYNIMQGPQPFALAISGLTQAPEPSLLGFLGLLALAIARKRP